MATLSNGAGLILAPSLRCFGNTLDLRTGRVMRDSNDLLRLLVCTEGTARTESRYGGQFRHIADAVGEEVV